MIMTVNPLSHYLMRFLNDVTGFGQKDAVNESVSYTIDVNKTLVQLILHKVFLTYLDVFLSFLTHMTALLVFTTAMGWLKTLLS